MKNLVSALLAAIAVVIYAVGGYLGARMARKITAEMFNDCVASIG